MRHTFILFPFILFACAGLISKPEPEPVSPLAAYSEEWNEPQYLKYNTAVNAHYMTGPEKELIYILNLLRANPSLFATTVLLQYPEKTGQNYLVHSRYYISLMDTLKMIKPVTDLKPDEICFNSAKCHALVSGISGYVGHERSTAECRTKESFNGECCDYGNNNALDIVLSLLIDEGVPSLGHRKICLKPYRKIGVSIQSHQRYRYNAVLDFSY